MNRQGADGITWTDYSWSVMAGCRRISPGCGGASGVGGCYAERLAATRLVKTEKYKGLAVFGQNGPRWTGKSRLWLPELDAPLRLRKPSRIFPVDMGDIFYEGFSNEEIAAVYGVMAQAPRHIFQVLTKRPERARDWYRWVASFEKDHGPPPDVVVTTEAMNRIDIDSIQRQWPLANVHLGVSAEDQERADERIPILLTIPAAVRWVSYEPALEVVDFSRWLGGFDGSDEDGYCARCGVRIDRHDGCQCPPGYGPFLNWIVVGGESGPGARPFVLSWARRVVLASEKAGVPCFVKQLGARPMDYSLGDISSLVLKDRHGGDISEFPVELRVREFPERVRQANIEVG